jgi:pantothenate kinase
MKTQIKDFAEALALTRMLLDSSSTRIILGITGSPGSGKSTFAQMLVDEYDVGVATIVPMDGFHYSNLVLQKLGRFERKGASDTFDAIGFKELLKRIRVETENNIFFPIFHREVEESFGAEGIVSAETRLVITEGNYLLMDDGGWSGILELLDECWYLEIDEKLRRDRLFKRHQLYGKDPESAKKWTNGSDQKNAELIALTKYRADRIVTI